ncbi:ABC transporter ATP-binding protein [Enterovibrio coralii]|uniref:Peptide ABC transporter ATP-binding protein n=1 Tax=Enterovibrio coralii TaxID=294935 RepID=A0A135I981_9GAMM|nr:oligopeptide/dipeptide ABC transporter ATP-binding protein [Enterovibrio coralii]KXF82001.1 peptide ABC transporter ATP-binding protein [Enterovibrio coralii]
MTILALENVCQHYSIKKAGWWRANSHVLKAVDGVSLEIHQGETVAVVGESGCGKSTLGRVASLLETPTSGTVIFNEVTTEGLHGQALRHLRRQLGLVFQDPYSAMNPRLPIGELVGEPLAAHNIGNKETRHKKVLEALEAVGLGEDVINRYPHEFSGGQRQRICIARALVLDPELIIADEPLSALDVSVQSQILNLFVELKRTRNLAILFISHDMAVVNYLADTIVVMYLGKVVEQAPRASFFSHAAHPYSQALLAAVPKLGAGKRKRGLALQGDVPSPINPPSGCAFHPRCNKATDKCRTIEPVSNAFNNNETHRVACHYPDESVITASAYSEVSE